MATEILMPRQGQSVESCIIIQWNVSEGDDVTEGDSLCEVETDKATFEVESTCSGTVLSILYDVDSDVEVLKPIAIIGSSDEDISSLIQVKPETASEKNIDENKSSAPIISSSNNTETVVDNTKHTTEKIFPSNVGASPRAKKTASEKNIDLSIIKGTGPLGRVIARDVITFSENNSAKEIALGDFTEIPAKGVRKIISERMLASLQSSAQLTINSSADAQKVLDLRKLFKNSDSAEFNNVSINDLILFIVTKTLSRHKEFNSHWENNTLKKYDDVHIGFAVDTPRGLMVPVLKNANKLSLPELSKEAKRLASSCVDGKINPDELIGATFTVTNLGSMGIESFTPVLNLPEVAILGICSIYPKPFYKDEEVCFSPHMGLSLTFNHCATDGAPAARFLSDIKNSISSVDAILSDKIF
tara:strand:+ start:1159 stop:2406 length:1248 start_codon:yes stop_codon:yes gene_type:complete